MNLDDIYNFEVHELKLYNNQNDSYTGKSFLRKTNPDFAFYPKHGSEIELNTGDLFLTAVNIYNNLEHYKNYLNELKLMLEIAKKNLREIVKNREVISTGISNSGLKLIDNDLLLKAYKNLYICLEQAFFYSTFVKYLTEDAYDNEFQDICTLCNFLDENKLNKGIITGKSLFNNVSRGFHNYDKVETIIDFSNGYGNLKYYFSDIINAIIFDMFALIDKNFPIKTCENCGNYFIPSKRSDEKYCDYPYENGKTCKEIGYINKVNSDDILKTYRSIYKTQNARKQRNKNNVSNIDDRFKKWHQYAKSQLELCKDEKISINEMITRINTSDWVKGGALNGNDN